MNNDLIGREEMKKLFTRVKWRDKADGEAAICMIETALAVDAVEVVRCKDCRYCTLGACSEYCEIWESNVDGEMFCSEAKAQLRCLNCGTMLEWRNYND